MQKLQDLTLYNEVEYEIISISTKKNLLIILPGRNFAYVINKTTAKKIHYQCHNIKPNKCSSKAYLVDGKLFIAKSDSHDHPDDSGPISGKIADAKINQNSANSKKPSKRIYDELRTPENAPYLKSYDSKRSVINKKKKKNRPPLPKTSEDLLNLLENDDIKRDYGCIDGAPFLRKTVKFRGGFATIFINDIISTDMREKSVIDLLMDATFSSTPKRLYQTLIISGPQYEKVSRIA